MHHPIQVVALIATLFLVYSFIGIRSAPALVADGAAGTRVLADADRAGPILVSYAYFEKDVIQVRSGPLGVLCGWRLFVGARRTRPRAMRDAGGFRTAREGAGAGANCRPSWRQCGTGGRTAVGEV